MLAYEREISSAREALDESVLPLLDDELERQRQEPEAIAQFKASTQDLLGSVETFRRTIEGTKKGIEGLEGHSQDLNRAAHKVANALGRIIAALRGIEEHFKSVVVHLDAAH